MTFSYCFLFVLSFPFGYTITLANAIFYAVAVVETFTGREMETAISRACKE